jgi:hypothetical protein
MTENDNAAEPLSPANRARAEIYLERLKCAQDAFERALSGLSAALGRKIDWNHDLVQWDIDSLLAEEDEE